MEKKRTHSLIIAKFMIMINQGMIDHLSYTHNLSVVKLKPAKNLGMNGIQIHDPCDTGVVLYQLSLKAN